MGSVTISLKTSAALKVALDQLRDETGMSSTELLAVMIDRWKHPRAASLDPSNEFAASAKDPARLGSSGAPVVHEWDRDRLTPAQRRELEELKSIEEEGDEPLTEEQYLRNQDQALIDSVRRGPSTLGRKPVEYLKPITDQQWNERMSGPIDEPASAATAPPTPIERKPTSAEPASEELQDDSRGEIF